MGRCKYLCDIFKFSRKLWDIVLRDIISEEILGLWEYQNRGLSEKMTIDQIVKHFDFRTMCCPMECQRKADCQQSCRQCTYLAYEVHSKIPESQRKVDHLPEEESELQADLENPASSDKNY